MNITIWELLLKNSLLFIIINLIGYIVRLFFEKRNNFIEIIYRFFIGLLLFVLLNALVYTRLNTIYIVFFISSIFFFYFIFNKKEVKIKFKFKKLLLKETFIFYIVFLFIVSLNYFIYKGTSSNVFFGDWDSLFYITASEFMKLTGIENPLSFSTFFSESYIVSSQPYHYFDLWLTSGLFSVFFKSNNVFSYLYIYKPIIIFINFLGVFLFISHFKKDIYLKFFLSFLFTFLILLFPTSFVNSFFDLHLKIPEVSDSLQMFRSHREISTFVILVFFFDFIKQKKSYSALWILNFLPFINFIHFFPIIVISFGYIFYISLHQENKKNVTFILMTFLVLIPFIGTIIFYYLNNSILFFKNNSQLNINIRELINFSLQYLKTSFIVFSIYLIPVFILFIINIKNNINLLLRNKLFYIVCLLILITYSFARIVLHSHEESWQFYNFSFFPISLILIISIFISSLNSKIKIILLLNKIILLLITFITIYGNILFIKKTREENLIYFSVKKHDLHALETKFGKFGKFGYYLCDTTQINKNEYFAKPFISVNFSYIKLLQNNTCVLNISINDSLKFDKINTIAIRNQILNSPLNSLVFKADSFNLNYFNKIIKRNQIDFLIIDKKTDFFDDFDGHLLNNSKTKVVIL